MCKNKLIIAAAGSGKTTYLVNEALKIKNEKVLITTFTQANEAEIRKKIIEINKCIPHNITIQTWFSFLLRHGVKPYQGCLFEKRIKGLLLVNTKSGLKNYIKLKGRMIPIYYGEVKDFEKHYFTSGHKIYSDKLSQFVYRCNEKTSGAVIDRISRIYSHIFIDEVQDLAGFDLELLKCMFASSSKVLLVGDPRQGTYSTHNSVKNKKYAKGNIESFFNDKKIQLEVNDQLLTTNYRSVKSICELSSKLFPEYSGVTSGNNSVTGHDGVFLVRTNDLTDYINEYNPTILRWDSRTEVLGGYDAYNFGDSKGLTFKRVLIYPTDSLLKWLKDENTSLPPTTRSKYYVALTRAQFSVGIIYDFKDNETVPMVQKYNRTITEEEMVIKA